MKTFLIVVADCKRDLQDPHEATQAFIASCGGYKKALFTHVDNTLDITIELRDINEYYESESDLPY